MITNGGTKSINSYINSLFNYARIKIVIALGLLILVGLTEGFGLLLLLPFLHLIGLNQNGEVPSSIAIMVRELFVVVGLPLNLSALLIVYVGLVSLRTLLIYWRTVLLTEIRLGFVDHLRLQLYSAISHANWLFLSKLKRSNLNNLLVWEIYRVGAGTDIFLNLVITIFMAIIYIIVAFQLSTSMTLIALIIGMGLLLLLWPQVRRAKTLGSALTKSHQELFKAVAQFLEGLKLAKSYGTEAQHIHIFNKIISQVRKQWLDFTHSNAFLQGIHQIGAVFALACLLYLAVAIIHLPPAELMILVVVFARLLPMLTNIQHKYQQFVHILPAFTSAMEMQTRCLTMAEPPLLTGHPTILRHEILLSHVNFRYDKQAIQNVLTDINLIIPARQTTALVGPSGVGKTTIADLLLGLLTPDSGKICVDGQVLENESLRLWRHSVGYVPQETFLLHDTIRANLLWAQPTADEEALKQALRLAAADEFIANRPQGLETVVGDQEIPFSGGERQRLALARALLRRPSLLLLDEATSALDNENEQRIQQAIEELHGELSIVVIAHRLSTIRHADQIVVIDNGRVVESGCWDELVVRQEGRLRALLQAKTQTLSS